MDQESGHGPLDEREMAPAVGTRRRRPYHPPTLTTFGSVEEFTRGSGTGKADTPFPGRVKN